MTRAAIASIAVALALACSDAVAADVCPPPGTSWLRVIFAGEGFQSDLRARVMEQLGADLRSHQVVLCEESDTGTGAASLADITLDLSPRLVLSLEVRDAVTDKRLARDLPLASVPRDALALSIALAAEELLHASWIEAALAPTDTPSPDSAMKVVPAAVREVNADQIARMPEVARAERAPQEQAAFLTAAEHATGGQTSAGVDARFSWGGRVAIGARAGFRLTPEVESVHGAVRGSELLAGLGLGYSLVPRESPWGAEIGIRADILDVQFSGVAARGVTQESGSAVDAIVSGALGGWARIGGPWRLLAEAVFGAPVRAVRATDGGTAATSVSGVEGGVAIGIGATLPR